MWIGILRFSIAGWPVARYFPRVVNTPKQLNIGLIGAGIVGGGVAKNLTRNADLLADRLGIRLNLKWVCDKDEAKL